MHSVFLGGVRAKQSVVVPVALVSRVTVAVVHVVHVVTVRNRHMPTVLTVHVGVLGVLPVLANLALIRVTVVLTVQMPVVYVVDVIVVRDCHVAASLSVRMVVSWMRLMLQGCRHFTHLHEFRPPSIRDGSFQRPPCFLLSRTRLSWRTHIGKQANCTACCR